MNYNKAESRTGYFCNSYYYIKQLLHFVPFFIRNGKSFPSFCPSWGKHSSAIGGGHSFTETVFIFSFCSSFSLSLFVSVVLSLLLFLDREKNNVFGYACQATGGRFE